MDRRSFTRTTALAAAGTLAAPGLVYARGSRADLVLRGAVLFDGTGAPGRELDVAVTGDRISAVGPGLPAGNAEIDLRGLALAPGFIDIHSHADMSLLVNNRAESRIRQGVTLEVVGQDGGSVGPWSEEGLARVRERYMERFGVEIDFRDPPGFLDRIDRERPAVSVATMVGNGALRRFVVGDEDRPATPGELGRMKELLAGYVRRGCVGMSSGLEYAPSGFASTDELGELASVFAGAGYPYASHMRNEDDRLLAAIEEALMVGRLGDVPVQISHLKQQGQRNYWKADAVLGLLDQAREQGVDVMYDVYPYTAYATGLTNLFPTQARSGGTRAFLRRLRDPESAERMERFARDKVALLGDWNRVQISSAEEPWAQGRLMGDLALERGVDPYELTLRLLESNDGGVGMIGHGMSEENVAKLVAHPLGMVCSDGGAYAPYGPLGGGSPHPRGYGTFPRLLGRFVRELGALSLEEAIHKITGMPARRLRLSDRGTVAPGMMADLVAFDPDAVADRATFSDPHQYPAGVPVVVVNGVVTLRDGAHTGELGGRAVRGGAVVEP